MNEQIKIYKENIMLDFEDIECLGGRYEKKLGAKNALYPMPVVIVGSEVDGKINYNTIAHVGIIDHGMLSISMGKIHYSNQGIKKNMTLSINFPSENMVKKADYVGIVSGAKSDKSGVFESFRGALKGAPMIKEAPLNMECEVVEILDRPEFDVFLVKIVNTYCDEEVLTDGKIDYSKVKPFFYDMPRFRYWHLGNEIARSYTIGKEYREGDK